jgi:hypothetical protein
LDSLNGHAIANGLLTIEWKLWWKVREDEKEFQIEKCGRLGGFITTRTNKKAKSQVVLKLYCANGN